jgi:hypothetical protein
MSSMIYFSYCGVHFLCPEASGENEPKERALFRRCFLKAFLQKLFKNRPLKAKFSPRLQKFQTLSMAYTDEKEENRPKFSKLSIILCFQISILIYIYRNKINYQKMCTHRSFSKGDFTSSTYFVYEINSAGRLRSNYRLIYWTEMFEQTI